MKRKGKLKGNKGFTLAETLLAVLILLLVSGIVAAGVPAAKNAYEKVVLGANAQVLLSTTLTALRDELGTAREVAVASDKTTVSYISADTLTRSTVYLDSTNNHIVLQEYAQTSDDLLALGITVKQGVPRDLVSPEAATADMYVTYSEAILNEEGYISFKGIKVCQKRGGETRELVTMDNDYSIEVLSKDIVTPA